VSTASNFSSSPAQPLPVTIRSPADAPYTNYDLAPDGTILVNDVIHEIRPPFTLLANWLGKVSANPKD
jgi:hypothetical protein